MSDRKSPAKRREEKGSSSPPPKNSSDSYHPGDRRHQYSPSPHRPHFPPPHYPTMQVQHPHYHPFPPPPSHDYHDRQRHQYPYPRHHRHPHHHPHYPPPPIGPPPAAAAVSPESGQPMSHDFSPSASAKRRAFTPCHGSSPSKRPRPGKNKDCFVRKKGFVRTSTFVLTLQVLHDAVQKTCGRCMGPGLLSPLSWHDWGV